MTTHPNPTTQPTSTEPTWTVERVRALGVTSSLTTAASVLGISRSQAYRLAATNAFPTPLIRAGRRVIVPVTALLRLLDAEQPDRGRVPAGARLEPAPQSSVHAHVRPPADYAHHRWRHQPEHPGDHA